MEKVEFKKVLEKALTIIEAGIKKGYFRKEKKEELTKKLVTIIKNGIVYDIYGTAIYGAYIPNEKRLYFNAKVFKNEQEALIYILHEIKHGLDHYGDAVGFENNGNFVGMNEGATQRFANDIAEEILGISIPKISCCSLGIDLETQLDEYQIEDKLNELFCITLGITIEQFIILQNDENKDEFNKLIEQFNEYADFNRFREALDMIYKIQEETWMDLDGNMYEEEKKPTEKQTERAINLINICKEELSKYTMAQNNELTNRVR